MKLKSLAPLLVALIVFTLVQPGFDNQVQTYSQTYVQADDAEAPTIALLSPANESVVKPFSWIYMNISDDVNVSHVLYHWDLIENDTLEAPYALMARTSEVGHYLYVYANDTSNNWCSAVFYFISDGTSPVIALDAPPENHTAVSGTTVNLTVTDLHLDQVEVSWDDAANVSLAEPFSTSFPEGDGLHMLHVYANDLAGNEAVETYHFITDDESPNISCDTQNASVVKGNATITILVDDASFETALYRWDSNETLMSTDPVIITSIPMNEGSHHLFVSANDTLGRTTVAIYLYEVDNTAPSIGLSTWANNSLILAEEVGFLSVFDSHLQSVWYVWDDNMPVPYGTGVHPPMADGRHILTAFANDSAGNVASEIFVLDIDAQNPRIQGPDLSDPFEIVANSTEQLQIVWQVEDEYPDSYIILMNGSVIQSGLWTSGTITLLVNPTSLGSFNYTLIVFDQIGRSSTDEVHLMVIIGLPSQNYEQLIPMLILTSASAVVSILTIILLVKKKDLFKK